MSTVNVLGYISCAVEQLLSQIPTQYLQKMLILSATGYESGYFAQVFNVLVGEKFN